MWNYIQVAGISLIVGFQIGAATYLWMVKEGYLKISGPKVRHREDA